MQNFYRCFFALTFLLLVHSNSFSQSNDPCGAPSLTVGASCTFQAANLPASATATTGVPAPGCASYNGMDVWYQVTVPANGVLTIDLNTSGAGPTDMGMAWYTAASCAGPFTLLECDDDDSNNGLLPYISRTGLTPGSTIWVRLWEYGGNATGAFRICSSSPSTQPCTGGANNNCATADPFCTGTAYNYCNSTGVASMGTYDCLISTPNPMWMYLNVQTSGNIDILIEQFTSAGAPIDVDFALYGPYTSVGNACANISTATSSIDCSFSAAPTETANIVGAVAGEWYMLLMTNYNGSAGYIEFSQIGGTGSTNCNIVAPCSLTATPTPVTCNGASNGSIAVNVTGGTPNFTVTVVNSGGTTVATQTGSGTTYNFAGLPAGTYTVNLTAQGPCTNSTTVTITQPTALTASNTFVNPTCNGGTNGSVTASASGGTTTYQYSINGGGTYQASPTFGGLAAGTYTITVRDANGCTTTTTATLTNPPLLTVNTTATSPTCNPPNTGTLTATSAGGTGAVTLSWTGGLGTGSPKTNVAPGTYTVTATDANGCTATSTATINQGVVVNANITPVAAQCLTGNSFNFSGSTSTISSGTITSYSWNFGDATTGTGVNTTHTYAAAGTYTVTLTASNGTCTNSETLNITVNPNPTVTVTPTNPLCNGGTGSLTATPSGGSTFGYSWSSGLGSTQTVTGVPVGGPYTVTVTNNFGCTATGSASITQPPAITATISGTNVSCNGGANGTASVTASGGTGTLTYSWSPAPGGGQGTSSVTGLTATTYTVTITDANGCSITRTFTPTQPTVLAATIAGANVSCNGGANGTSTVTPSGGTAPYSYNWSPAPGAGQGTATATGLSATTYTVTITDANGCVITRTFTPTQPTVLTASISGTNVSCNGGANGTATVSASGGTAAYTYNWSPAPGGGQGTATATGLSATTYTVTITDANGCVITRTFTPTQPTVLAATISGTNVSCNGGANGTATVVPSGGTAPYAFNWSPAPGGGQGTAAATGLTATTYTVTITDANGCVITRTFTPTQPTVLTATIAGTNVSCNGGANGTSTVTPSGGTAPYSYIWSPAPGGGQGTATATGLSATTYTVTVTDANGCVITRTFTPTQPTVLSSTISGTNINCNGAATGAATVVASGGTAAYTYNWSPAPGGGQGTATATGLTATTYTVTITDANGCTTTNTFTPTQPTALIAAIASQTNVNCNGAANGSVNISASGGTSPYQFNIGSGNQPTGSFTGLTSGAYTVTITDANGCTTTVPVNITQPAALTATIAPVALACNNVCNATATVTPGGGSGTYTYAWNNATFSTTATTAANLCAQTYTVTVADAAATTCTVTASITVTQPTALSLSTSSTNTNCGGSTGTTTVTASGGAGGYTYSWNTAPVQTTATATGLPAGAYTVTVTDANGCSATANVSVNNNTAPTISEVLASHINVSCNGGTNGSAAVSASGGTAPLTYAWSPSGGTGTTATGLAAGTYNITVTDANGCSASTSITITQPTVVNASASVTANVLCNGGTTGSANANASGGTGTFTYAWFSGTFPAGAAIGQTTATATGLAAGAYYVVVTDGNGCAQNAAVTITQPTALTATATGTNITCNGTSNGSIALTSSGGTAPYTFAWTGPAGYTSVAEDPTGLAAGTYNVTVTDVNGCTATTNVIITQPTAVSVSATNIDANCGQSNGSVTANGSGGTGVITYSWNTTPIQNTATASNLPAGTYTVIATDANGCTATTSATVTNIAGPTATAAVNNNATGAGLCNGSATVTPTGGVAPYTYLWANGVTTATAANLCAGNNCVTVTDAAGCTTTVCVTITEPGPLSVSLTPTNLFCNGVCNGAVSSSASGGVAPYTYLWSNGATTANITGVCAGNYSVTVTDANGNTATASSTVTEPTIIDITSSFGSNPLCFGACDGTLSATANGGTGALTYSWSGLGAGANQTGVCSGTYTLTVTDANGCSATNAVTLNNPTQLLVAPSVIDAHCGLADGSASANATGGTGAISYSWNTTPVQTTATATNIAAGTYNVTATDANGCSATGTATVANLAGPVPTATVNSNATGAGICNGSATVTVAGGIAPYSFLWSNGATTATVNNLCAGNACVTVTDASGCSAQVCVTITQPLPLVVTLTPLNLTCNGTCIGQVSSTVTGGVAPYTYSWSNGSTNPNLTGLCAGNYSLTVIDANGNIATQAATVSEPTAIVVSSVTATPTLCNASCDGQVSASASGGTGALTYVWTGGLNGANQTGLCAGTYNLVVTDANACSATGSATVTSPAALAVTFTTVNSSCGNANGSATATVTGGTAPYTYNWNAGSITDTQSGVAAGTYSLTITDANGCTLTSNVTINDNAAGTLSMTITSQVTCNGAANGSANGVMTGGAAPFNYSWNTTPVQTTQTATNLAPGTWTLTVTDANGCPITGTVTITEPSALLVNANHTDVQCAGGSDGTVSATISGGVAPYTIAWTNSGGANVGSTASVSALIADTYTITVTDANGCISTATVVVAQPAPYSLTVTPTDAKCFGSCDGLATATVVGGTTPYSYQWNDALTQVTAGASFLCAGNYSVTVTDAHNCVLTASTTIGQPTAITMSSTAVDAHCQQDDGSGCITVSGGVTPYAYNWLSIANTTTCGNNLFAGTYLVEVTDANDCRDTVAVVVNDIAGPTAVIIAQTNVSCNSLTDGSATVNMVGGTGIFTVLWDPSANGQTTPTASNLGAGTYAVSVTDAAGCSASTTVTITEPPMLVTIPTSTDPTCFGYCDGVAWVAAIGGTTPYAYDWRDNGNNTIGTNDSLTNLCLGSYTLVLTDANGCIAILDYTLNQPVQVAANIASTPNLCNAACDGTATVTPTAGVAPYSFAWNDPSAQTGSTATSLCAGNYSVIVTDADGCQNTFNTSVTEPTPLVAVISASGNVSCAGFCDGFAQVTASGGTAPYTYAWSNGIATATNNNICIGTYIITVTDANGCVAMDTVDIIEPSALSVAVTGTDNTCYQSCDGTATATINGGVAPYNIQWDDPAFSTTAAIVGLCANTFSVVVTDANGCFVNGSVVVNQPTILDFTANITDAHCTQADGFICANIIGGVAPYTYLWSDPAGQTTPCAFNITAGCYTLTITDGNGCVKDSLLCLNDIAGPTLTIDGHTDVTCFGLDNGTIDVTATGGTGALSITWLDGVGNPIPSLANLNTASPLDGGTYGVLVTDAAGCIAANNQFIFEPTVVNAAVTAFTEPSCNGSCDATATVSMSGGVGGFTILWNSGTANTALVNTGLCAGPVSVTVTDANGCSDVATGTITQPTPLSVTLNSITNVDCFGACNGAIVLNISGATAPYSYIWTNGVSSGPSASAICDGTYTTTVTDNNGCVASIDNTITQPTQLIAVVTDVDATCSQCNGTSSVVVSGGITPYQYAWSGGTTPTQTSTSSLCAGNYTVNITDGNGCLLVANSTIIDLVGPSITNMILTEPSCTGFSNGTASVNTSAGTAPLQYAWDDPNAQTTQTATNLVTGLYCVVVSDANNCNASSCINVTEPTPLLPVGDLDVTICYGDSTQLWASGAGGNAPYSINWQSAGLVGSGPILVEPIATTTYCFNVIDANGCISPNDCITITVNPQLQVDVSASSAICNGDSITLNAQAIGGNGGPYTFTWTDENGNPVTSSTNGNSSAAIVNPTVDTWYYVLLSDGCSIDAFDSVQITINALPLVFLNVVDSADCAPHTAQFILNTDIGVQFDYDFQCDGTVDYSGTTANTTFT
jgi:hypothetical protein